jgi:hypothetical protein
MRVVLLTAVEVELESALAGFEVEVGLDSWACA